MSLTNNSSSIVEYEDSDYSDTELDHYSNRSTYRGLDEYERQCTMCLAYLDEGNRETAHVCAGRENELWSFSDVEGSDAKEDDEYDYDDDGFDLELASNNIVVVHTAQTVFNKPNSNVVQKIITNITHGLSQRNFSTTASAATAASKLVRKKHTTTFTPPSLKNESLKKLKTRFVLYSGNGLKTVEDLKHNPDAWRINEQRRHSSDSEESSPPSPSEVDLEDTEGYEPFSVRETVEDGDFKHILRREEEEEEEEEEEDYDGDVDDEEEEEEFETIVEENNMIEDAIYKMITGLAIVKDDNDAQKPSAPPLV